LDFEIKRIDSEISRPGWTSWAILGGIASAAWLLSLEIEKFGFNSANVLALILALNIVYDTLNYFRALLEENHYDKDASPKFGLASSLFSASRSFMLLDFIRYGAIIYFLRKHIINIY